MLTRPLIVLCMAAVAACVVVQKDSKEQQRSEGTESRVAQLQFPEEHVRQQHQEQFQHVLVPQQHQHLHHQIASGQLIGPGGGVPHHGAVGPRHPHQEGVAYQYVPVQYIPVPMPHVPQHEKPAEQYQVLHRPPPVKEPLVQEPPPPPQYETQFVPSHGSRPGYEPPVNLIAAGSPHVHFPEEPDHHHRHPHEVAPHRGNREHNLKRVLVPLAGIALLGAAAALATNPILLQLGVVSGKRRRRDVAAFELGDLAALEDLGPRADEASPFKEAAVGSTRLKEIAVLQKFLREQDKLPQRSQGNGDALLSALLSCSGLADPRNLGCLQRIACEAYDPATELPELEMQVLRIVVREMASHPAIPKELSKKVRLAAATGRKGKCELTYRCPQKAWDQCVNPKY
ncbi:uncharacterized protein LOC132194719 isoform X2 [Neocloeon triangulifer]|uniref:uncharacterized protein LOC132194719 isoform X2 n=1 Tax=Neocloeon triangulifer TaxID=2078957 RepID=UPI00286F3D33|nr:uncharacterized protein LOC132194719 isoform X2 [Neocloeon triangulifer]